MKTQNLLGGLAAVIGLGAFSVHGLEANNNGAVEAQRHFSNRDADNDGFLTLAEYKSSALARRDPARATERFHLQDINKDNKLTLEEFSVHPSKREISRQ